MPIMSRLNITIILKKKKLKLQNLKKILLRILHLYKNQKIVFLLKHSKRLSPILIVIIKELYLIIKIIPRKKELAKRKGIKAKYSEVTIVILGIMHILIIKIKRMKIIW